MRKLALYPKLAVSAIRKNIRIYLPYLLACTGTVMMFDLLLTLTLDGEITAMRGGGQVQMVLSLGCVVVALFSAILLFYTNGVIIRQRKREFGLYNILGMEKRHIALVLLWETFYTALISLALGILGALVFSKLIQMVLLRMLGGGVDLHIRFQTKAAATTSGVFLAIFALTLAKNLTAIHRAKPVELLRSAVEGEREPKSRWLLALLGVLALGTGYGLSLRTNDIYNALMFFFVAVILVIIGTYLLFTAFSIVFLKALRRNRRYYYKTNHFVAVSGMLYRMKRNAMGLASICILSTMVLITVSTTFSLYVGLDEVMEARYPSDVICEQDWEDSTEAERADARERLKAIAEEFDLQVENEQVFSMLSFFAPVGADGKTLDFDRSHRVLADESGLVCFNFIPQEDYIALTGVELRLNPGEALAFSDTGADYQALKIGEAEFELRPLESFPLRAGREIGMSRDLYLVVDGRQTLEYIDGVQRAAYGRSASAICENFRFDLAGPEEDVIDYQTEIVRHDHRRDEFPSVTNMRVRQLEYYMDYLSMYGAMFFLGMFLGLLFIMTTVTIMYYKQVSEGLDDRGRYAIMRKVGMTHAEVRSAIRSQILTVFFLPLGMSAAHVACAFPMVLFILRAFGMYNARLFALCTLGCFGVFAALYVAVYLLTARAYYRIVDGRQ